MRGMGVQVLRKPKTSPPPVGWRAKPLLGAPAGRPARFHHRRPAPAGALLCGPHGGSAEPVADFPVLGRGPRAREVGYPPAVGRQVPWLGP